MHQPAAEEYPETEPEKSHKKKSVTRKKITRKLAQASGNLVSLSFLQGKRSYQKGRGGREGETKAEQKARRKEHRKRRRALLDNQHPFEEDPGTDGPPVQGEAALEQKLMRVSLSWGSIDHHITDITELDVSSAESPLQETLETFSEDLKPVEHQMRIAEYLALYDARNPAIYGSRIRIRKHRSVH